MAVCPRSHSITAKILAIELAAFGAAAVILSAVFLVTQNTRLAQREVQELTETGALISIALDGSAGDQLHALGDSSAHNSEAHLAWRRRLQEFHRFNESRCRLAVARWDPARGVPVTLADLADERVGLPLHTGDPEVEAFLEEGLQSGRATAVGMVEALFGEEKAFLMITPVFDSQRMLAGGVIAEFTTDVHFAFLRQMFLSFLIYLGIFLLIVLALTAALSLALTRPLASLVCATEALGGGDFDHPVKIRTRDEVGVLARTFEAMRRDLKEAQDEALSNMRLSTVGRMASGIIHDFKSPMTAISGYAQLMTMPDFNEEQREEFKTGIIKNIDVMVEMTQDLLEYSRGQTRLNVRPVSAADFISDIAQTSEPALRAASVMLCLESEYDGEVMIDEIKLRRVVLNLMTNAREAMGSGGEVHLSSKLAGERWRIEVRDNGPGIPDEIRDSLFEPFATHGKATGTGLGLALAKQFVEQHAGAIDVETERNKGTAFFIELPLDVRPEALDQAA